jgi:DnaK suppressor protein
MATARNRKPAPKAKTAKPAARAAAPAARKAPAAVRKAVRPVVRAEAAATERTSKSPRPKKPSAEKSTPPAAPARAPAAPKSAEDREWMANMRDSLLHRREQLMSVVRSNRDQLAESKKDYADIGDRASGGFEDELAAGLLSLESAQLEEIEEALSRIRAGSYGACSDCGKPIPRKRLEILPFAKRCLACEGQKERHIRPFGAAEDEGEESEEE